MILPSTMRDPGRVRTSAPVSVTLNHIAHQRYYQPVSGERGSQDRLLELSALLPILSDSRPVTMTARFIQQSPLYYALWILEDSLSPVIQRSHPSVDHRLDRKHLTCFHPSWHFRVPVVDDIRHAMELQYIQSEFISKTIW